MSDLTLDLTVPNGLNYKQACGLFINNELVRLALGQRYEPETLHMSLSPLISKIIYWYIELLRTEAEIASIYAASTEDIDVAVKSAPGQNFIYR